MRTLTTLLAFGAILLSGCDAFSSDAGGDRIEVRYLVDGNAAVSYLGDGGLDQAQARGAWEAQFTAEPDAVLSVEATSIDGSAVRAQIEVDGVVVQATQGLAVRLDSRTDDRSQGVVEVHGPVEAVGADRVTVLGRVFVVDAGTRLFGRGNEVVPFATFTVGTFVEAEGRANADGTFQAKKVKLDDGDDEGSETEVEGRIEILDAASVTVAGTRFTVDAATRWLDDDNDPLDRSSFAVGDRVEAEGYALGGVLYAKKIKQDDD